MVLWRRPRQCAAAGMAALSGLPRAAATPWPTGEDRNRAGGRVAAYSVSSPAGAPVEVVVERATGAGPFPGVARSGFRFPSALARAPGRHRAVVGGAVSPPAAPAGVPIIRIAPLGTS